MSAIGAITAIAVTILAIPLLIWLALQLGIGESAAEAKFNADYKVRSPLSDETMINEYFRDVAIDPAIPVRIRRIFGEQLQLDPERIWPDDDLFLINDSLDLSEVIFEAEEEFNVQLLDEDLRGFKGTTRDIAILVQRKLDAKKTS